MAISYRSLTKCLVCARKTADFTPIRTKWKTRYRPKVKAPNPKEDNGKLKGIVVAPLTHFNRNGNLNLSNVERCGKFFKESKFNGMFVNGTIGEGMSMTNNERKKVAEKWKEVGDSNGLFTILHIGAGNLRDTQDLARHAKDIGVDAIATLPPTYHKPTTEEQLIRYLEKVAEVAPKMPLFYYEYNITTGVYLNIPSMLHQCAQYKRVPTLIGLKHTSPDLSSALQCATIYHGRYRIFFGSEMLYLPSLSLGIPDVITTPVMGEYFYNIKQDFDSQLMEEALRHQKKAKKLHSIIQRYGGGISTYKALFKLLTNIDVGVPRLPLLPLDKELVSKLNTTLVNESLKPLVNESLKPKNKGKSVTAELSRIVSSEKTVREEESLINESRIGSSKKTEESVTDESRIGSSKKTEENLLDESRIGSSKKTEENLLDESRIGSSEKTEENLLDESRIGTSKKTEENLLDESRIGSSKKTEENLLDESRIGSSKKTEENLLDESRIGTSEKTEENLLDESRIGSSEKTEENLLDESRIGSSEKTEENLLDESRIGTSKKTEENLLDESRIGSSKKTEENLLDESRIGSSKKTEENLLDESRIGSSKKTEENLLDESRIGTSEKTEENLLDESRIGSSEKTEENLLDESRIGSSEKIEESVTDESRIGSSQKTEA